MPIPGPTPSRPPPAALILPTVALLAAAGWLLSRVWLGLDFTDEMQYYGEIQSLTRTSRFFVDDLALQQLGYFFVWPLFKLHALLFPDQSYLVLFGRGFLLAAYGATGALFWHAVTKAGEFTRIHKIAGLTAFLSWVPFQIFAFSYNTTSYLLIVALLAVWIMREARSFTRYALAAAGLLTVLTYTYPPAGLGLIFLAVAEAWWRVGRRQGVGLLLATFLSGVATGAVMLIFNGPELFADLLAAVDFSRAYGVGAAIRFPYQFEGWLASIFLGIVCIGRLHYGRPFSSPWNKGIPPVLRWVALGLIVMAGSALLGLIINWAGGYLPVAIYLGLLLLLASAVGPAEGQPPNLGFGSTPLIRWILLVALGSGIVALLVMMSVYLRPGTGYFALTLYLALLTLLALTSRRGEVIVPVGLVTVGTISGAIFSYTSSNGLPNFGVGAASVIPFLFLYCARGLDTIGTRPSSAVSATILSVFLGFFLGNGVLYPYAEQKPWKRFVPVKGVPAYRGIWTSPLKIEAVERFQAFTPRDQLQGKRILIIGPQPWLYFALGGQPATPMIFMHFDGNDKAYQIAADRLFRGGMPDAILLAQSNMPQPFAARLMDWAKYRFFSRELSLPDEFVREYAHQTGYRFASKVFLLERHPPARPKHPAASP